MSNKYCIACGIPGRISGIALHQGNMGNSCHQPKFFLERVCADADRSGIAPHVYLKQLLDDQQLLPAYAGFTEPIKRPREEVQENVSQQPTQKKERKICTVQ